MLKNIIKMIYCFLLDPHKFFLKKSLYIKKSVFLEVFITCAWNIM